MKNPLPSLNLPIHDFKIKSGLILDIIRKKWVTITPEEWVRQNFLAYLIEEKKFPKSLIKVEQTINVFKQIKRCDAVVYSNQIKPLLILECKNPDIKLSKKAFGQIAIYNSAIKAPYLIVTNGLDHFCIKFNFEDNSHIFLNSIPFYGDICL